MADVKLVPLRARDLGVAELRQQRFWECPPTPTSMPAWMMQELGRRAEEAARLLKALAEAVN